MHNIEIKNIKKIILCKHSHNIKKQEKNFSIKLLKISILHMESNESFFHLFHYYFQYFILKLKNHHIFSQNFTKFIIKIL